MSLNREWIEARIPHQGRMCLLDEVLAWDAAGIRCRTRTHLALDHPLRSHGRLGIACGLEYAAQAMALHGALAGVRPGDLTSGTGNARPQAGFLASVRDLRLHALRLDDVDSDLFCQVIKVAGDATTALYEFTLSSGASKLLCGRATAVLDANHRLQL